MTIQKEYNPEVCSDTLRIEKVREDITDKPSIDGTITKETSIRTTLHQEILADGTVIKEAVEAKDTAVMQEYAEKNLLRATIEMKYRQPTNIRRSGEVTPPAPGPTPSPTFAITGMSQVNVGESIQLGSTVAGASFTGNKDAVATVTVDGKVTGISAGTVVVTAHIDGYKDVTKTITVKVPTSTTKETAYVGYVREPGADPDDPVELKGAGIAEILTTTNIKNAIDSGYTKKIESTSLPNVEVLFPSTSIGDADGDGDYYVYVFYAFPKSTGTVSKYKDVAANAYSDAWTQKEVTIDGKLYTVCYYKNGACAYNGNEKIIFEK